MPRFRRARVVRRLRNGRYELLFDDDQRDGLRQLLGELSELLEGGPDDPSLRRLHPPAYLDDDERDTEYQLLAGEELRASRQAAVDTVLASLGADEVTDADLWSWLQALNAIRLVIGTRLDVSEDHVPVAIDPEDSDLRLWALYDLTTGLQHAVVEALGS